jgi:hypothetical protein
MTVQLMLLFCLQHAPVRSATEQKEMKMNDERIVVLCNAIYAMLGR